MNMAEFRGKTLVRRNFDRHETSQNHVESPKHGSRGSREHGSSIFKYTKTNFVHLKNFKTNFNGL